MQQLGVTIKCVQLLRSLAPGLKGYVRSCHAYDPLCLHPPGEEIAFLVQFTVYSFSPRYKLYNCLKPCIIIHLCYEFICLLGRILLKNKTTIHAILMQKARQGHCIHQFTFLLLFALPSHFELVFYHWITDSK